MAHEVTPWKQPNCELSLKVSAISDRETYAREINEKYGEGGGLNANYQTVEAVAIVSNLLGRVAFEYGKDFVFKTGTDFIVFDFCDEGIMREAESIFHHYGLL